jgi:HK97 family phage prohead protease
MTEQAQEADVQEATDDQRQERPTGQLEYRAAEQIGVDFPKRTIELVVMPYDVEALVPWPPGKGERMVREVVTRGAFEGIERRSNRVRVNRDHDVTRTVGRAIAFHPSREQGLVAELRIAQTDLGDETLTLADEEILDASAGFLPMPGGESWPERNLRRLSRLWLAHIAMTPDPAYMGANVLAVRSTANNVPDPTAPDRTPTPNLDQVRAWLLQERYDSIDV